MLAEQEITTVQLDEYLTVFDVWKKILEDRPEVVRQTAKVFAEHPHGQFDDQDVHVLPIERIKWSDDEKNFFGNYPDVKAIGSVVETRPENFDPEIDYSGAGRWFNEGDILDIDPDHQKSFIMVDLESPPNQELLQLTIKTLKDWRSDWYLMDSGGSFHLVINKLVDQKDLPKYFGQLIMDMARNLNPVKSKFYGHIGNYLIENSNNKGELKKWAESVLDTFGHMDEPLSEKFVFPIDMRYLAHVIESICRGTIDEGCLRVSSKHGSVPILKALQVNKQVTVFEYKNDPFNRKQLSLPTL